MALYSEFQLTVNPTDAQLYHFLLILSALCRFWLQQASVFSKNTENKSP